MGCTTMAWPQTIRPSRSPEAAVRAATATRSRAATAKPPIVRSSMSVGVTPLGSAIGCKTASPPGLEGNRHDGDRGVHPQRRDHRLRVDGDNPQRRRDLLHSNGERMVQGGVLQGRRHERRLLDVSDPEQQRRPATYSLRQARTTRTIVSSGYTDSTNYLTPVGAFAVRLPVPTGRTTRAVMFGSGTKRLLPARRLLAVRCVVYVAATGAPPATACSHRPAMSISVTRRSSTTV